MHTHTHLANNQSQESTLATPIRAKNRDAIALLYSELNVVKQLLPPLSLVTVCDVRCGQNGVPITEARRRREPVVIHTYVCMHDHV